MIYPGIIALLFQVIAHDLGGLGLGIALPNARDGENILVRGESAIGSLPAAVYSPAIWKNWAGVSTVTPKLRALSNLLPAFSPQTR